MLIKDINHLKQKLLIFSKEIKNNEILLLKGNLGAGKTTFVKEFLNILYANKKLDVKSPTFTILNLYEVGNKKIYHYDLYRIKHIHELEEIGFFENLGEDLIFIEWPEIILDYLKHKNITFRLLTFKLAEDKQRIIDGI